MVMVGRVKLFLVIVAVIGLFVQVASGQIWYMTGKVVMEDGSPPPKPVTVERYCGGTQLIREALTGKDGRYRLQRIGGDPTGSEQLVPGLAMSSVWAGMMSCVLRVRLDDYESNTIDITNRRSTDDPNLPPLVLRRRSPETTFRLDDTAGVPKAARKAWERAGKATQEKNWAEAERHLRLVVKAEPRFSQAWHLLGIICQNQNKVAEARSSYRRAIESSPKVLAPYVLLARLDITVKNWQSALETTEAWIKADTKRRFPEAYVHNAMAKYNLHDLDGAEASAREAVRLDKKRQIPRAEYVLGVILGAKRDSAGATEHLERYLKLEPKASDAEGVRKLIARQGRPEDPSAPVELAPSDVNLPTAGEAWVPGGIQALARAMRLSKPVSAENFFSEYCQAIVGQAAVGRNQGIPGYRDGLVQYFKAVGELAQAGEEREGRRAVALSLATPLRRAETERVLATLGWKIVPAGDSFRVELGDQATDGPRQSIPSLFAIDEIAMQEALQSGGSMAFEVPSESARLIGGGMWNNLGLSAEILPGGLAEAFARDLRLAKVYAGLSDMGIETATAVVAGAGLRALVELHADLLARHSDTFRIKSGSVDVPGGADAEAAWARLAGTNPRTPPGFFRALLEKDRGRLLAYYAALARTDPSHQRYFTKSPARLNRFYEWYRESDELRDGAARPHVSWHAQLFNGLPLDAAGELRFPGGLQAWQAPAGADENFLLMSVNLEALVAVARLEQARKTPLDEGSVKLLARYASEWRHLFPYFERLPGLGRTEYEALESFVSHVRAQHPSKRNLVLGQWHSLVELIALGVEAGSLSGPQSSAYFRQACRELQSPGFSAKSLNLIRAMSGGAGDLDRAVPEKFLRLSGERHDRFERVRELQKVPSLDGPPDSRSAEDALAALSGTVYAAWLDPDSILVSEDAQLLRKHQFMETGPLADSSPLFPLPELRPSNTQPGSLLYGGFGSLPRLVRRMAFGGEEAKTDLPAPSTGSLPPKRYSGDTFVAPSGDVFRADARLVEVPATVTDGRGRYIDGLEQKQFVIVEQGQPQPIAAFESQFSAVSCALLLDTTLSMQAALPSLKSAALKLIEELREGDSVAVYSFNRTVSVLQSFTTDKQAAKRAVLRTYPYGTTALNDALVRVSREIAARSGKKVIIVFTDGADNNSVLTAEAAVRKSKMVGAPVYSIAQGAALDVPILLKHLQEVAVSTGGVPYSIRHSDRIREVFEGISNELKHGYLLAYRPPAVKDNEWRKIDVQVNGAKGYKVRAREGYYPQ